MFRCHYVLENGKAVMKMKEMHGKRVVRGCFQEYISKIKSVRFLCAVLLMVALICSVAKGMDKLMIDTKEWVTPWMAPHFFDNLYFVTFYGFIICYMYSDVPFMNHSELYKILREGRMTWCVEKMVSIVLQAFTMVGLTILASILVFIPRLKFEWEWGRIIYTMTYSESLYEYNVFGCLSSIIYTKYTPVQAMLLCFFMVGLISSFMGLLMFAVSLYANRMPAVSIAAILTGLNLSGPKFISVSWLPYVIPFYWCRISIYGQPVSHLRNYPSLTFYIMLSCIVTGVSVGVILLRARRIEYVWNKEE